MMVGLLPGERHAKHTASCRLQQCLADVTNVGTKSCIMLCWPGVNKHYVVSHVHTW